MSGMSDHVARAHFNTSNFDAWRAGVENLYEVTQHTDETTHPFFAEVKTFYSGSMMVSRTRTRVQQGNRTKHHIARDGLDHIVLRLFVAGGVVHKIGDDYVNTRAGDIHIMDIGQEAFGTSHDNGVSNSHRNAACYENIQVVLPRDSLVELVPNLRHYHQHILRAGTPMNTVISNHMMMLYATTDKFTAHEAAAMMVPTSHLLASALNSASDIVDLTQKSVDEAVILSIKNYIDAHIHEGDLGPDKVAKHLGVSRMSLFRICEPLGGIQRYILNRRLKKAYSLIAQAKVTVSIKAIAYSLGFASPSSFARSYRQRFGVSPSETYEKKLLERTELGARQTIIMSGEALRYNRWMESMVG